ncbi:hypothetical protein KM043_012754 [Ampulex compressa]|nr:hypothetical protein KM043_012754 [Ampulex compressa]
MHPQAAHRPLDLPMADEQINGKPPATSTFFEIDEEIMRSRDKKESEARRRSAEPRPLSDTTDVGDVANKASCTRVKVARATLAAPDRPCCDRLSWRGVLICM